MSTQRLPIGIQNFREIRERNHFYVDKTEYAGRLVESDKHNFLSRPRRFGKSLFVDTLKELFEGSEELFRGLSIYDRWDWSVRHPVVRLDFSKGIFTDTAHLSRNVIAQIRRHESRFGIELKSIDAPERLSDLIMALVEQTGKRVVVLVDEYDAPILDVIKSLKTAEANRDFLASLYSTVKFDDANVEFSFFTGISRFSRASLFSKFNNMLDITLDPAYSAICGYTENDLDEVFGDALETLDRDKIREWYNGYNWRGEASVYNPISILLTLRFGEIEPWWFETGTPKYLTDVISKFRAFPIDLERMSRAVSLQSTFDIDKIQPVPLLFQTGYLTIAEEMKCEDSTLFRLDYPNREVRQSFGRTLMEYLVSDDQDLPESWFGDLRKCLKDGNLDGIEKQLNAVFASIPYQWHTRGKLANYEAYFASVVLTYFSSSGAIVRVEDPTSSGRIDMVVETDKRIYIFEFKTLPSDSEGSALEQIENRDYAGKYKLRGKTIHLVGAEFDSEKRDLVRFDHKQI